MATQDMLRNESIDLSDYIRGNEKEGTKQQGRFRTAVQVEEIEHRGKKRISPTKKLVKALSGR